MRKEIFQRSHTDLLESEKDYPLVTSKKDGMQAGDGSYLPGGLLLSLCPKQHLLYIRFLLDG
jgi:hypothetical protein